MIEAAGLTSCHPLGNARDHHDIGRNAPDVRDEGLAAIACRGEVTLAHHRASPAAKLLLSGGPSLTAGQKTGSARDQVRREESAQK